MNSLKARKDGQLLDEGRSDPEGASSNDERSDGCMVRKWLSPSAAAKGLVVMNCVSLTYHALILTGKVDYRYVWGGQLKSKEEMYIFEALSVSLNLLMLLLVLTRGGWLNACPCLPASFQRALCALFCGLFACNTVGTRLAHPTKAAKEVTPLCLSSCITHAVAVVKGNEQGNFFSQDRFKLLVDIVKNLKEKGTVLLFVPEHVKMDAMVLILQKGGIPDVCKYRSEVGLGISTEKALDPSFQRNPRKNPNKRAPPAEQDISPLQALQQGQDFVEHLEQAERRVLVAKAQEGRGIDLPNVRYVVQLQLPEASGEYLHLAGRTGRMGATGTSITLVTEAELEGALPLIGWKIGASFDKWDVERGQIAEGAKVQATFS